VGWHRSLDLQSPVITHELQIDMVDGIAGVILELTGEERYAVLRAVNAPLSPEWSCKVFVTLNYEALTEEAKHLSSPLGSGDDGNYSFGFDADRSAGGR